MADKGERVLVTGASGFIGSHLVPALVAQGYQVTTFGRSSQPRQFKNLPVQHRVGDVTNAEQVKAAMSGQQILFHMAGLVSYKKGDLARLTATNVEGTRNVMAAALEAGLKRVIHTSSVAAFGVPPLNKIGNEALEYNLAGMDLHYCDTKQEGEKVVQEYFQKGLNVVILNPGIIFGEDDTHPHHLAIFKAMSRGFMFCVPAGGTPYSDIQDVVAAHINAIDMGRAGERYSLVSANLSYMEAGKLFASLYKCSPPKIILPPGLVQLMGVLCEDLLPIFHIKSALTRQVAFLSNHKIFFDCRKAEEELAFKPTPFADTIKRTAAYYLR